MELLYLILGALLAVGGGFLSQRQQQILARAEADRRLLIELNALLLHYHAASQQLVRLPKEFREQRVRLELELIEYTERISRIAVEIRSKEFRQLAVDLTKFALDEPFRTAESLYALTRQVQLLINRDVVEQYEKEKRKEASTV